MNFINWRKKLAKGSGLLCRQCLNFIEELIWYWSKLKSVFFVRKDIKVKLVAIAKDECAYLPDWIFHHLYLGFDHLSIYVNNTNDNTDALITNLLLEPKVSFLNGDQFFSGGAVAPQIDIYKSELVKSKKQGFSHVMFLDIDEFWVPQDLKTTIHQFLKENHNEIICFEWLNRINENERFMDACPPKLIGNRAQHVKSIISTDLPITKLNPHGVMSKKAKHKLADGTDFKVSDLNFSKVSIDELNKPLKAFFIMHRMYRSEDEYIALLARGRPIQNRKDIGLFKNNRNGYIEKKNVAIVAFPEVNYRLYMSARTQFYFDYKLLDIVNEAIRFVLLKRDEVVDMIRKAPKSESDTLRKILKRVSLKDVIEAYSEFKRRHKV